MSPGIAAVSVATAKWLQSFRAILLGAPSAATDVAAMHCDRWPSQAVLICRDRLQPLSLGRPCAAELFNASPLFEFQVCICLVMHLELVNVASASMACTCSCLGLFSWS